MSRPSTTARTTALLLAILAAACGAPQEPVAERETAEHPEIAWFDGTPEEAFALAEAEGKPLFLYWGAEWCPPCHYLKEKIFHQPEFVEGSRAFVMVYLDGDQESAQILGEQLDVQGYPTVIVYAPDGRELLRMSSDLPVSRYAAVMERALRLDRPIEEILRAVLEAGPAASDPADLDVLAYHSWGQDSRIALPDEERLSTFRRLWEETPSELEAARARFLTLYVGEAVRLARAADEGASPPLADDQRAELSEATVALLGDPELRRENVFDVSFGADGVIELLAPEAGARRTALIDAWRAAAEALENDERLTTEDRLSAVVPRIDLARVEAGGEEAPLPDEVVERVRRQVAWAVDAAEGAGELQAVLNTAAALLDEVGLSREAQELLSEKLDETHAPYYFISWLAGLKSDAGETEAAIDLYRRAWQAAEGRYTRFRWGSTYLRRLVELAPQRAEQIEEDSMTILGELLTHDDAFALGNALRLGQLESAYREWNEGGAHDAVLARIRERVAAACDRYSGEGEGSQRERCVGFLEGVA